MRTWMIAAAVAVVLVGLVIVRAMIGSGVPVEAAPAVRGPIREFVDERGKTPLPQTTTSPCPSTAALPPSI